jgi:hypothetical protein
VPNLIPHQHLRALTDELAEATAVAGATTKGRRLIKLLQSRIKAILTPPQSTATPRAEQRVRKEEQRVIDTTPILTIPQITDVPPIMQSRNPTRKRTLKNAPRIHGRVTRNNSPGIVPLINSVHPIPDIADMNTLLARRRSPRTATQSAMPPTTYKAIPSGARPQIVMQQAINVLPIQEKASTDTLCTPRALMKYAIKQTPPHFKQYTNPMVHPVTGKTISSYKKFMNDPDMAEIWQTAFGFFFSGMSQGDNKIGQKGTNTMFVMNHKEIQATLKAGKKFTYANPVVDHQPQKADPNQIRTTAGGDLIQYNSELLVPTADINTAKLH